MQNKKKDPYFFKFETFFESFRNVKKINNKVKF